MKTLVTARFSNQTALVTRNFRMLLAAFSLNLVGEGTALRAIDRHPELQSRPVAWTEFDGGYLVDTNSRAEMLNFYWTVFAKPFPTAGWTGSLSPAVAGATSELWRTRVFAQVNAYRALNYSPAMVEDTTMIPFVQEGALVLALNSDKPLTHSIDSRWVGYNATAAEAVRTSLLGSFYDSMRATPLSGVVDGYIVDAGESNANFVGHRGTILHDSNTKGTIGAALDGVFPIHLTAFNVPFNFDHKSPIENFIAWPAPGMMPLGLFRGRGTDSSFRWSLEPMNSSVWAAENVSVDVKVNGVRVTPQKVFAREVVTWEFLPSDLDLGTAPDGTTVDVTIAGMVDTSSGQQRTYHYTVRFFDENRIEPTGFNALSPLMNISTRGQIGTGENVMIAGFNVSGEVPIRVAVRTQGPGLARFGVQNTAKRTHLTIFDAVGHNLGENAGWRQHQDWRLLQGYNVAPSDDAEAGMVLTLWPGNYTAVVSDDTGTAGTGIVEVFAIDNLSQSKLGNLSTRGVLTSGGETMIAGVVLKETRTIIVRTQGPGLARFGVANPVADTTVRIVDQATGVEIASNDDWRDGGSNARLSGDLAAFAPSDPREAALVITLPAGAYTAVVGAKQNAGVGIVEVFDIK